MISNSAGASSVFLHRVPDVVDILPCYIRHFFVGQRPAIKCFGETRSRTILCVQRVSGALPLTSRGEFSQWRKLPKKQSGCLFALLAAFVPNSVQDRLYRVFCYTEIEGKDRITRGFRPQKLGITAFFVLSFPPYSLKIFFKIPIRLLHFKRIYAILKKIFGMHYKKH